MNSLRQIAAKASEKPLTLFSYFRTCVACLPSYLFTLIPPLLWRCNHENKQRSFTENSRRTVTRFQLSVAQPVKVHDAIGQSVYYNYKCLSVEQKSQHLAGCLGNVNYLSSCRLLFLVHHGINFNFRRENRYLVLIQWRFGANTLYNGHFYLTDDSSMVNINDDF